MTECEICLEPDADGVVTVEVPDEEAQRIIVCQGCLLLMFDAMVVRYKAAVEQCNASVRQVMELLGIEVPA